MSETTPPTEKPTTRAARKPKAGGLVKLADTGGYGLVVGDNLIVRLGPAEAHELETEAIE